MNYLKPQILEAVTCTSIIASGSAKPTFLLVDAWTIIVMQTPNAYEADE
jgi:hypothetical protein